jgi:hypothetical protein
MPEPDWTLNPCIYTSKIAGMRTGGVAQVVEQLLCKCEALISNPSPAKKKKK